jgi:hypothetical protein
MISNSSMRVLIDVADKNICETLEMARRLATDSTWQDCAETSEAEAHRFVADLLDLRANLLVVRKQIAG